MTPHKKRHSQRQTLVLIHGWGLGSSIWRSLLPYLSESYSIVRVDLPGYAENPVVTGWQLDALTNKLAALVDEPARWCGWSLGGLLATEVASRFPEKVQSLITLGTNPAFVRRRDWPHGVAPEVFARFRAALKSETGQLIRRFTAMVVQGSFQPQRNFRKLDSLQTRLPDSAALHAGLSLLEIMDVRQHLATLKMPHRHILGESDVLVPVAVADDIARLNHKAQVEVIPAAHWLWADNPRLLAEIIAA